MGGSAGGQGFDVDISFVDGQEKVLCAVFGPDGESTGKVGVDSISAKVGCGFEGAT